MDVSDQTPEPEEVKAVEMLAVKAKILKINQMKETMTARKVTE